MRYFILATALFLTACSSDKKETTNTSNVPVHHKATVLEIIPAGGYLYMLVEEADSTFWISSTDTWVKPGAEITFLEDIWMTNFESKNLEKTFDKILFTSDFQVTNPGELDESKQVVSKYDTKNTSNAGEMTIPEVLAKRTELKGKKISVKGNVLKVSENILNNNWIHITDEASGKVLIFVSPDQTAVPGENVKASGIVTLDKDLGYGYFYETLIENATIEKF